MVRLASKYYLLAAGILVGIVYGLITRLVWGQQMALASITYLFLIPAVLGIVPLIFSREAQVRSYLFTIFLPWITLISFFLAMWMLGIESVLCLMILGAPFFVLGTLGALVFRLVRIHLNTKKNTLPAIAFILLPLLVSPIESTVRSPSELITVSNEVIVHAPAKLVWENVVRVPEISGSEFTPGFFNSLGIPRPVEANLVGEKVGGKRTGHFDGGLTFHETITEWRPHQRVSFDIVVAPDTIANRVFDQHVLMGNYFSFVEAGYEIDPIAPGQVRLRLSSRYRLISKVNFYGRFWGNLFLSDFQDRLLRVIKTRCEADVVPPPS